MVTLSTPCLVETRHDVEPRHHVEPRQLVKPRQLVEAQRPRHPLHRRKDELEVAPALVTIVTR